MEEKIIFSDLYSEISQQCDLSVEEVELFSKELFSLVQLELSEDNPVKIKDFGTFKLTPVQARESVDVNTGEKIEIPAHKRVSFLPATKLRDLVNKPFSHFETTLLNEGFNSDGMSFLDEDEDGYEDFTSNSELEQEDLEKALSIESKETFNPVFDREFDASNQSSNITEPILPQTQIHVTTSGKEPKKTPYGIWGVLVTAAAMVGAALLIKRKE